MGTTDKKVCTSYKLFECAFCIQHGKETCCLSIPKYQKSCENWKKRMHEKADEIHALDLQIEKLQMQRKAMIEKLPSKDRDRVRLYLEDINNGYYFMG